MNGQTPRSMALGPVGSAIASEGGSGRKGGLTVSGVVTQSGTAGTTSSKKDSRKGRHVRQSGNAQDVAARYEPRGHTYSASLRDGPPKLHRDRRRSSPSSSQRRFRDYSSVTKDGVTVLVPTRR